MPKKTIKVRVRVTGNESSEGVRCIKLEVESDEEVFLTSDIFAKEGVIEGISGVLKERVKEAVLDYVSQGPALLREAKQAKTALQRVAPARVPELRQAS